MPARFRTPLLVAGLLLPGPATRPACAADTPPSPEDVRFFETRIRPVLLDDDTARISRVRRLVPVPPVRPLDDLA